MATTKRQNLPKKNTTSLPLDELPINNGVGSSLPMQTPNLAQQIVPHNTVSHPGSSPAGLGLATGLMNSVHKLFGGGNNNSSTPSMDLTPRFLDPTLTEEDIYTGAVPVTGINHRQDSKGNYLDKNFEKLANTRPEIAQAITDRKNYEHQQLVKKMTKGDNGPGIDPMAVQLLFQNAINPFMQGIVDSSNKQADNYASMMGGLLKDSSLPEAFRRVAKVQVPTQVNDMKNMTSAAAMNTASSPGIAALINLLNEDKNTQQYLINQNKLGQQLASGQGFSAT